MARRADIDLLFGLLALQNGLIEQGTLFSAFTTWAREKDRAMAEILVGQGALDAQERGLLEGLVARHLERHGGDASKSLSSLSSVDSVRQELSQLDDAELQASLAAAGPEHPRTEGADADQDWPATSPPSPRSATASIGMPSSAGLRFRILRPHARGGLGEVYVAHDEELHREVALKQIQDRRADDPDSRSRFVQEAEITGALEHPGIVPVYGLGHYPDGRPFYAMRFIRGDSLKEAIERFHCADEQPGRDPGERALALRQLLGRFVDVCNAVAYAHSRGVLHRDLKPGNVMLGPYGETLVVDWGLAKPVGRAEGAGPGDVPERTLRPSSGSGVTPTQMGSAIGTPAFMSPEQAAGRLDELGPASDVYSLGAVLYSLLTGRIPFDDAEIGEILRKVRAGEFPPPRQVNRAVPAALEAVCLTAMAREAGGRYPSPRALADEIERWLADEPVTAWRDPLSARAARWVRRHRTLAAGIAVFLVVAVAASSVGAILIDAQRAEAERHRGRAEANLAKARRVVDDMYTWVAGQLEDVPRMDEYQRTLLDKARDFYEHDALPQSRDPATRLAAAGTQLRVADIQQKLGRLDEARAAAGRALALYESLHGDDPDALDPRRGCAEAETSLGRIEEQDRNFTTAAERYRQAIARRNELARSVPSEPRYRLELGVTWRDLGQVLVESHRLDEADSADRTALGLLEPLAAEHPEDGNYRTALAESLDILANLYVQENRDPESEGLRRRALALRQAVLESRPGDPKASRQVAWGMSNLGYTLMRLGRLSEAEAVLRDAIARGERIYADHPDQPANRIELSRALNHRADLLLASLPDEALASYRRALEVLRLGRVDAADRPEIQSRLAVQFYTLGRAESDQKRLDDADSHLRECVHIGELVLRDHPDDRSFRILRGQAWLVLGLIARDRGRIDEAVSFFRRAAESHEAVLRGVPGDPQVPGHLVEVLVEGLGKTYREMGRAGDALASYRRAADLLAAMEHKDRTDLYNLACCLAQCSALGGQADDAGRAVEALRHANDLGACTYDGVRGDTDLDPLRGRADFDALVMDLAFPADPFAR